MPSRTHSLILVLGAFSGACADPDTAPAPVDRVFLISCDTLRADRLGFYGYERDVSPSLDAFAEGSQVYEEAYACAPMTQPAVSSLLAGRFPTEIGVVPGNRRLMPPEIETLPETIARSGIETAAVVSNYLLRKRKDQSAHGVSQGFDHFDDAMPDREVNRGLKERTASHTTDAAIAWLEGHLQRGTERCFMWVHYQDPHGPYTPPAADQQLFEREAGDERVPLGTSKLGHRQIPGYQALEGSDRPDLYRDRYDAEIHYFDAQLGRLFDWMRERDLLENSLVVFTADHGESLGEHDYWFCHGENLHREVVRVPFFVRAPERFELAGSGRAGDEPPLAVSHLDVLPTVLDAFGLAPAPGARGRSLLRPGWPESRVVSQVLLPSEDRTKWFAASDGRYRLLWTEADQQHRLYDVRADPAEEHDIAAQHPARVEAMLRALGSALDPGSAPQGEEMTMDSPEDEEALKALGYADGDDDEDDH